MFRSIFIACFTLLFATPAIAEFGPRVWGSSMNYIYVSKTEIAAPSGHQSLCVEVEDSHALFVPFRREVKGYVLSETACKTQDAEVLPIESIPALKAASILPANIPNIPTAPIGGWLPAKLMVLLSAMSLCALQWCCKRRTNMATRRIQQVSGDPLYFDALMALLFHIARTDGVIAKSELEAIRQTYSDATGTKVTPEITASHFARFSTDSSILRLVGGYRGIEAEVLLKSAIQVATHNGCIPREKMRFLTMLNNKLGSTSDWFEDAIAKALCPERRSKNSGVTDQSDRVVS